MKKTPEIAAEPFLYKVTFHRENKDDIQKAIDWINNNGGKLDVQLFRVPHDFIEMEIR